jgi:hypothetical protein
MERPYLDKWQQYLLSKAKGPEKPPYFKNIWGSLDNIGPGTEDDVTKTMSRILKQPVTLRFTNPGSTDTDYEVLCLDSDGAIVYVENAKSWNQTKVDLTQGVSGNWYSWGSDGGSSIIRNHDKNWDYMRQTLKGDKTRYFVIKKDSTKLKMNNQIMEPQSSPEEWAELRPGTKAYDAVKQDVFKD